MAMSETPKWSMKLDVDSVLKEKFPPNLWIEMVATGKIEFKFEILYYGEPVFILDSHRDADMQMFVKILGNDQKKMPWECLLDDANRIE